MRALYLYSCLYDCGPIQQYVRFRKGCLLLPSWFLIGHSNPSIFLSKCIFYEKYSAWTDYFYHKKDAYSSENSELLGDSVHSEKKNLTPDRMLSSSWFIFSGLNRTLSSQRKVRSNLWDMCKCRIELNVPNNFTLLAFHSELCDWVERREVWSSLGLHFWILRSFVWLSCERSRLFNHPSTFSRHNYSTGRLPAKDYRHITNAVW